MKPVARLAALLVLILAGSLPPALSKEPPRVLSRATLLDKIRGGWAGQMIGVAYGAPTEFKSNGRIGEWPLEWKPGMLENTLHQDDLYVEMTFAQVMDSHGIDAPMSAFGEAFKNSGYHLWHANAAARRLLNLGIHPPWSGHPKYNVHANDIDFQIEADFIGLMSPGLPRVSNRLCNRVGRVMNYGDGLYGGMFVCGMVSAAYFESNLRHVVEAGLACIPPQSGYARLIQDVLDASARHPKEWRAVWQIIETKWNRDDPCPDGALVPFNIDARLNGAYIAFGLLFGEGDFEKTMEIATRCGQDSDCNPSSAAGVLGVVRGFNAIPDKFTAEFPQLAGKKFSYTDYSFDDIVRSTENRALEVIRRAGGFVSAAEVRIPVQTPRAPKLQQWNPGKPTARVPVSDASWSWTGSWQSEDSARSASSPQSMATLTFDGVAVAILGRLDQRQGRAEILLDGRKVGVADGFIVERTHDNALWHTYGLRPGRHTLEIKPLGSKDLRSQGTAITLQGAVIYGPDDAP